MPVVAAMCLINQLTVSPERSAILSQGVGHSRKAFVDLRRRQVHVAKEYAAFEARKQLAVQNGSGMKRVDTNSHISRQLLELDSGWTVFRHLPKHMGSTGVAGYGGFSEVLLQGRPHGVSAALVGVSKTLQMACQAPVPDELGQRSLL